MLALLRHDVLAICVGYLGRGPAGCGQKEDAHSAGILANRGQKTELVRNDGKFAVKVLGSVGESAEIQSKINKEDSKEGLI